jgi:leucyl aminopeptidase
VSLLRFALTPPRPIKILMTIITDKKAFTAATSILAIDKKRLAGFLEKCGPVAREWITRSGFEGSPNSHCIVPGRKATIEFVLAGVKSADDPYCLSHLPMTLPKGRYALAKKENAGPPSSPISIAPDRAALAWGLGSYEFTRYKKAKRKAADLQLEPSAKVKAALDLRDAIFLVRDLVNTPTEDMGPEHLADIAREQAELFGGSFDEWVGDELLEHNFPAIHAVGRASHRPPRLLEITWGNPKHPRIAVVGKGVCFDSGGLDIKSADGMRLMKKDMGGAAHALGLARLIMQQKLPVSLHVLIPAVENAISGSAYRPGDVIRTRNGLTVEIGNTDAEGRVVLADALAYAAEENPALIIDFATLTGAARVALGPELPALYSNRDDLAEKLLKIGEELNDPMWRMPLWRSYLRFFDSDIANINNSGRGGFAGSIVAALFLEHFVPGDIPWIHFDLYAWNDINRPGRPLGGEAQGLRAMLAMIGRQGY